MTPNGHVSFWHLSSIHLSMNFLHLEHLNHFYRNDVCNVLYKKFLYRFDPAKDM